MVISKAKTVTQYIKELNSLDREIISTVRALIQKNLPNGIKETMDWGMINYEIPLETYPVTYNKKPLSVMSLAAQKHHYALYLHGVYCDEKLHATFTKEAKKEVGKLNMGKSCLRFKNLESFPVKSVQKVIKKVTPEMYIKCYEKYKKA